MSNLPATQSRSHRLTRTELWAIFKDHRDRLMNTVLNNQQRGTIFNSLWNSFGPQIDLGFAATSAQQQHIEELEEELQGLRRENVDSQYVSTLSDSPELSLTFQSDPPDPELWSSQETARLSTTSSVAAARAAYDNNLRQLANATPSERFTRLTHVDAGRARAVLQRLAFTTNETGCKLSSNKPSHKNGYVQISINNVPTPQGTTFDIHILVHQLPFLASGNVEMLRSAMQYGTHQISHLCHNSSCFNPDHLVVETAKLNMARKTCQGHKITRFYHLDDKVQVRMDGAGNELYVQYHPCVHGTTELRRLCILPTLHLKGREHVQNK